MAAHRYNFDLLTAARFRESIDQYGRMRRLEAMTPQAGGPKFNELVAELLRCWVWNGYRQTSAASARST